MIRKLSFALLLGVSLAPSAAWAGPTARLLSGGGCVKDSPQGACKEVEPGAKLATQSSLVAGKSGAVIELADKSVARLSEGSELQVLMRTKVQLGKGDTAAEAIKAVKGKVFVDLAPARGAVLIKGPQQLAAIVKRGSALIKVSEEAFLVASLKGVSLLGSGSEFSDVNEGYAKVLRKGESKPAARELLKAPESRISHSILLRTGSQGETPRLSWNALAGASGYEISVSLNGAVVSQRKLPKETLEVPVEGLSGGAYEVTVRGVDSEDLEGPWSAPARVNVASVELPPGAVLQGDSVQLPEKGKLKFKSTEGLEASFDALTTFVPVPGEVGLAQGLAQTLRLRRKGESAEVRVRIIPRGYKAQVGMSPKNARWPRDPVLLDIQLVSGDGGPGPAGVEMNPRVTIDQEAVTLEWSREQGRLRATLAPRGDKKPHVIRVEVVDQYGFFLGRNFLEVAAE